MRVTTDDPDAKSDDYERGFEQGVRSVLRIRCFPHKDQPQLNATEITGGECASCAWDAGHAAGYEAAEAKWRPVVELAKAVVEDGELTDLATGRCPVSEHLLIDLEKALRDLDEQRG